MNRTRFRVAFFFALSLSIGAHIGVAVQPAQAQARGLYPPVSVALRNAPLSEFLSELGLQAGRAIAMDGLAEDVASQPTLTFSCQNAPLLKVLRALACASPGFVLSGLNYEPLTGAIGIQGAWIPGHTTALGTAVTFRGGQQTLGDLFAALAATIGQELGLDGPDPNRVIDYTFGLENLEADRALKAVCALTGTRPIPAPPGFRIVEGSPASAPQVRVSLPGGMAMDVIVSGLAMVAEAWTPATSTTEGRWQSSIRSVQKYPQGEMVRTEGETGFLPPIGVTEPPSPQNYLQLSLRLESDDPRVLMGLAEIQSGATLVDDQGTRQQAIQAGFADQGVMAPAFARYAFLVFPNPPVNTSSLRLVEGQFLAFEQVEVVEFSFPADAPAGAEQERSGILTRLVSYSESRDAGTVAVGYELHVPQIRDTGAGQPNMVIGVEFHLIDPLDTLIHAGLKSVNSTPVEAPDSQGRQVYRVELTYAPRRWQPVARHTFSVLVRENPTVRIPFRLEAVPLPPEWSE